MYSTGLIPTLQSPWASLGPAPDHRQTLLYAAVGISSPQSHRTPREATSLPEETGQHLAEGKGRDASNGTRETTELDAVQSSYPCFMAGKTY